MIESCVIALVPKILNLAQNAWAQVAVGFANRFPKTKQRFFKSHRCSGLDFYSRVITQTSCYSSHVNYFSSSEFSNKFGNQKLSLFSVYFQLLSLNLQILIIKLQMLIQSDQMMCEKPSRERERENVYFYRLWTPFFLPLEILQQMQFSATFE